MDCGLLIADLADLADLEANAALSKRKSAIRNPQSAIICSIGLETGSLGFPGMLLKRHYISPRR
jgi:hypothetical protein